MTLTQQAECVDCHAVLFHVVDASDHVCNCGGQLICGHAHCEQARPYPEKHVALAAADDRRAALRVPPFCVSIIVSKDRTHVVNDIVYYETIDQAIEALRRAADRLEHE